jgi:hypothetical protein
MTTIAHIAKIAGVQALLVQHSISSVLLLPHPGCSLCKQSAVITLS